MKKIDAILQKIKKKYRSRAPINHEHAVGLEENPEGEASRIKPESETYLVSLLLEFGWNANDRSRVHYMAAIYHLATNQLGEYNKLALEHLMAELDECNASTLILFGIACLKSVVAEYEHYVVQIKDKLEQYLEVQPFSEEEQELFTVFLQDIRDKKSISCFRGRLFAHAGEPHCGKSIFEDVSIQTGNHLLR
ncbi:MAG: hypothetical protein P4L79_06805 [Legionella sp.]|uniref:hypothetical protein n=1 Tax=Legionella sp. TaxID=459 RepID=UPI0028452166|nr:hypothetical protein [Legionella sp.]